MQGIELVESRLFKVVKITDRDGADKHHHETQSLVYEKIVNVLGLKAGKSAVFAVQEISGTVLHTSTVDSIDLSISSGLPIRLTVRTRNTVYILDEFQANKNVRDVYHGSSPSVLFFDTPESEMVH